MAYGQHSSTNCQQYSHPSREVCYQNTSFRVVCEQCCVSPRQSGIGRKWKKEKEGCNIAQNNLHVFIFTQHCIRGHVKLWLLASKSVLLRSNRWNRTTKWTHIVDSKEKSMNPVLWRCPLKGKTFTLLLQGLQLFNQWNTFPPPKSSDQYSSDQSCKSPRAEGALPV